MDQVQPDSTVLSAAQIAALHGSHDRDDRVIAIGSILHPRIEASIEAAPDTTQHLIALLDVEDGDPCLEIQEPDATAVEWSGRGAHRFNLGEAA